MVDLVLEAAVPVAHDSIVVLAPQGYSFDDACPVILAGECVPHQTKTSARWLVDAFLADGAAIAIPAGDGNTRDDVIVALGSLRMLMPKAQGGTEWAIVAVADAEVVAWGLVPGFSLQPLPAILRYGGVSGLKLVAELEFHVDKMVDVPQIEFTAPSGFTPHCTPRCEGQDPRDACKVISRVRWAPWPALCETTDDVLLLRLDQALPAGSHSIVMDLTIGSEAGTSTLQIRDDGVDLALNWVVVGPPVAAWPLSHPRLDILREDAGIRALITIDVTADVSLTAVRIELPPGSRHGVRLPYGLELQIVGAWAGDEMDFADPAYISMRVATRLVAGRYSWAFPVTLAAKAGTANLWKLVLCAAECEYAGPPVTAQSGLPPAGSANETHFLLSAELPAAEEERPKWIQEESSAALAALLVLALAQS
jgi:hypothetical protein